MPQAECLSAIVDCSSDFTVLAMEPDDLDRLRLMEIFRGSRWRLITVGSAKQVAELLHEVQFLAILSPIRHSEEVRLIADKAGSAARHVVTVGFSEELGPGGSHSGLAVFGIAEAIRISRGIAGYRLRVGCPAELSAGADC